MASKYPDDDSDNSDSCKVNSKHSSFSSLELLDIDYEIPPEEHLIHEEKEPDLEFIESMIRKTGGHTYTNEEIEAAYKVKGHLLSDRPSTSTATNTLKLNPLSPEFHPGKSKTCSNTYGDSNIKTKPKIRTVAINSILQKNANLDMDAQKRSRIPELNESFSDWKDGGNEAPVDPVCVDLKTINVGKNTKKKMSGHSLTKDINPIQKVLCWLQEPNNYGKRIREVPKPILSTEPAVYVPKQEDLDLYNELKKNMELNHPDSKTESKTNVLSFGCVQDKLNKSK